MTVDESIPFGGSVSEQQFFYVQRNLLPGKWKYWPFAAVIVGLGIFNISVGPGWSKVLRDPLSATGDLLSMLAVAVVLPLVFRRMWARAYREARDLHGKIVGDVCATGVNWKTDVTNLTMPWEKFIKARVLPDLVLLFYSPRCALYFPRHFFSSDEAWTKFGQAVSARLRVI